jgi:hypothetical protein
MLRVLDLRVRVPGTPIRWVATTIQRLGLCVVGVPTMVMGTEGAHPGKGDWRVRAIEFTKTRVQAGLEVITIWIVAHSVAQHVRLHRAPF